MAACRLPCPKRRPTGWRPPDFRLRFVTFHIFRHTWATWMRMYGGADLQGLAGTKNWRDPRSVARYAHVVPRDEVLPAAMDLAATFAAKAPWACRATKIAINYDLVQRATLLLEIAMSYEGQSARKEDHKEALAAFVEKRPAEFTGR